MYSVASVLYVIIDHLARLYTILFVLTIHYLWLGGRKVPVLLLPHLQFATPLLTEITPTCGKIQ
jgi:hypothetical protein